ncbi:MAG TPA: amidohydrolase family protein [Solirubrobacteraceae bacterium]
MSGDLLLYGAGTILTGDLAAPRADGDAIRVRDGLISTIGSRDQVDDGQSPVIVDVGGATVAPGLIDPHTHPVLGDYTPRQGTSGWITSYLNGGVTTLVSAGEAHWPGRPRTAAGVKAVAIAAAQSAANLRPGGAKLVAGALLLERGLTAADIGEMAAAGVRLFGEIGLGGIVEADDVRPLVDAAHAHGWIVPMHIGGASVPGSHVLGAEAAVAVQPDVASHTNGGPTARSLTEIETILDGTEAAIEVVQAGNIRALRDVVTMLRERGAVDRLQIGTDTPSGTGVVPLGMLRTIAYCCAFGGLEPEIAICAATGRTAARYKLESGQLAPGRPADLIVIDAPVGGTTATAVDALATGDSPGIAAVIVDGEVKVTRSRVTPPPIRPARIVG